MKKLSILFMALVASMSGFASTKIGDFYYNLNSTDKTAELTYESLTDANYTGLTVADIKGTVQWGQTYKVTSISDKAFANCKTLETLIIADDNIALIGTDAFAGCSALKSVTIGKSVRQIRVMAFSTCYHIESVQWNPITTEGFEHSPFIDSDNHLTSFVFGDEVEEIPPTLCCGFNVLTSIVVPNSVKKIGSYGISHCEKLSSITLGNNVKEIGSRAFYHNHSLLSMTIPNSVETIDDLAFTGCQSLKSITIGQNVASLGTQMFRGCSALTTIHWNAKNAGDFAHNNTPFEEEEWSVKGQITTFTFGEGVEHIPAYLCQGMKLSSFNLPSSLLSIGEMAFADCNNLASITIPDNVTTIGIGAFGNCSALASVTIGKSVKSLSEQAFDGSSNISTVQWNARRCNNFSETNKLFQSQREKITSFTFGEAVEYIPIALCVNLKQITKITLPHSVQTIGTMAFAECSAVQELTLGSGTQDIGKWAFGACTGLKSVTCYATSIPRMRTDVFLNVTCSAIPLFVPSGSVDDYKEANQWKAFYPISAIEDGIEEVMANPATNGRKVLIDGQVLIRNNDKLFNLQGQEVK